MMRVFFLVCDILIPLIILILAVLMKRFPPRYGSGIGYRTSLAEKNELTWNTAQWLFVRYALISVIPSAVIGIAGGVYGIIKRLDEDSCGIVCVVVSTVQAALLFAAIILTETGLHRRFDKNGNMKNQ